MYPLAILADKYDIKPLLQDIRVLSLLSTFMLVLTRDLEIHRSLLRQLPRLQKIQSHRSQ
jgi:hypothetical protein